MLWLFNADSLRNGMRLLEDEQWGQWSDREIARRCLVTHKTVSHLRKSIWGNSPDTKLNKERKVQRGGKIYTVNTANIGKTVPRYLYLIKLKNAVSGIGGLW